MMKGIISTRLSSPLLVVAELLVAALLFAHLVSITANANESIKLIDSDSKRICSGLINYRSESVLCYDHPIHGKELHVLNGSPITMKLLLDLGTGPGDSSPTPLFVYKGELYFTAETAPTGPALWAYNGELDSVRLVKEIEPGSFAASLYRYNFRIIGETDRALYVVFNDEVIVTDGSRRGTHFLGTVHSNTDIEVVLNGHI